MELEIEINKLRQRALAEDASLETIAELRSAVDIATGQRTVALEAEAAAMDAVPANAGETAEIRQMLDRGNVGNIFDAALHSRPISGAEAELQAHYGVGANSVPLAMLAGAEERAAAAITGGATGGTAGYAGPLFAGSLVAFANGRIDSVPAGVANWPVLATDPTTATHTDSTEVAETTGAITIATLDPHESRASFAVRRVDLMRFPALGDGLRETLRGAVVDQLDREMLVRAGAGLMTSAIQANPDTPGATTTFAQFMAAAYAGVDGRYAQSIAQIRMIVHADTYGTMGAAAVATTDVSAAEKLAAISGGVRVSPHAPTAANYDDAVVVKVSQTPNVVAAVWPAIDIVEDTVTRAAHGEIRLHGIYLSDFAILRAGGYVRHRFRNA